jgi:hypothetical protein
MGYKCAFTALIFFLATQGFGQTNACFQTPVSYSTGASPATVLVGDFNNDGNPDFAVDYQGLCEHGAGVDVFLGDGSGRFRRRVVSQIDASPYAFTIADLNGDGKLDIAAALGGCGGGPKGLEVSLGNGDGTFQRHQLYFGGFEPSGVAAADFNSDGKVDLVLNSSEDAEYLWLGNGDGTFTLGATYPPLSFADFGTYSVDMNRDGIPDVITRGYIPHAIFVQLGNGDGTFASPLTYDIPGNNSTEFAFGDVNGDGYPDIVLTNASAVLVYTNNGDGSLALAHSYAVPRAGAVAIGDLNGDGIPDLVVTQGSKVKTFLLFAGMGDGSFSAPMKQNAGFYAFQPAIADFNHDGFNDVVLTDAVDGKMVVLLNTGSCH